GRVVSEVMQLVEYVDEHGLRRACVRAPLQDRLLGSLDDVSVQLEPARNRIAECRYSTQPLELGPEGNAALIGDAIAELGARAAAGFSEEMPDGQVAIGRRHLRLRGHGQRERSHNGRQQRASPHPGRCQPVGQLARSVLHGEVAALYGHVTDCCASVRTSRFDSRPPLVNTAITAYQYSRSGGLHSTYAVAV